MAIRKAFHSLPLVATVFLAFLGSLSFVTSFTAAPSRVVPTHHAARISVPTLSPNQLHHPMDSSTPQAKAISTTSLNMNFSPPGENDPGGLNEGKYILVLAMFVSIWLFSIPPEFRRARFCTEEDVRLYPEKCMTFDGWKKGIGEYYSNGGGVKFDFTVEGKE